MGKNVYNDVKKKNKIRSKILQNSVNKCGIVDNNIVIIENFNTKNNIYINPNSSLDNYNSVMKKSFSSKKPVLK